MSEDKRLAALERFFADVDLYVGMQRQFERRTDRWLARRFNAFEYIDPDENLLSKILADLLDPRGPHGQGDTFLELFLTEISSEGVDELGARAGDVRVAREVPTTGISRELRRIDVLLEWVKPRIGMAIENKPWALEQPDQVRDYAEHLNEGYNKSLLIYLTPAGHMPESVSGGLPDGCDSVRLVLMSYRSGVTSWLERCARASDADRVRVFLWDLHEYVVDRFGSPEMEVVGD